MLHIIDANQFPSIYGAHNCNGSCQSHKQHCPHEDGDLYLQAPRTALRDCLDDACKLLQGAHSSKRSCMDLNTTQDPTCEVWSRIRDECLSLKVAEKAEKYANTGLVMLLARHVSLVARAKAFHATVLTHFQAIIEALKFVAAAKLEAVFDA